MYILQWAPVLCDAHPLLHFAASYPCHLSPGALRAARAFWLRPNLRPLAPVTKYTAEVEARLLFATQALHRHIKVWKGCGNTPIAFCYLPFMSFGSRSTLRWLIIPAQAQPEALGSSATVRS